MSNVFSYLVVDDMRESSIMQRVYGAMPIQVIECGVQSWVEKLKLPKRSLVNPSSIQKKTKTKHPKKKKAKESIIKQKV